MSSANVSGQVTIVSVVAPASGTGRTSAVVNLAWILASAGKKVLIADLDPERPSARRYLQPFHVETRLAGDCIGDDAAADLTTRVRTGWGLRPPDVDPTPPEIRRYRLAGEAVGLDLIEIPNLSRAGHARPGEGVGELKAAVKDLEYDYVLIDHPTDASNAAMTRTALLSDVVAVCFRLLPTHIPDARRLAEGIRRGSANGVRVIAVPAQVQPQGGRSVDSTLNLVRAAFAKEKDPALAGAPTGGIDIVEIPYRSYGHDAPLAVLVDEPGIAASLLSAYEQLASDITEGAVSRLAPVSAQVRTRYRQGIGLEPVERPETITLVYLPEDRPWADWIQDQFERVGVQVEKLPRKEPLASPLQGAVVVVMSPRLVRSPIGGLLEGIAHSASGSTPPANIVGVRVEGGAADIAHVSTEIDISAFPEPRARAELLTHFGFVYSGDKPLSAPGFPGVGGTPPKWNNLPPRNPEFVGRHEDLERLRDGLVDGQSSHWTLSGPAGTGKSEIAREYGHRFANDYDIVWWVHAGDREQARECLTQLARVLTVDVAGDAAASVVTALAHDTRRWLLIYDNADDPDALDALIPDRGPGHVPGHVVLTSRSAERAVGRPLAKTAALTSEDAITLLRRVPGMTDADAGQVARSVEYLPIALHLAAAWLRETCSFLRAQDTTVNDAASWATVEFIARHQREIARCKEMNVPGMQPVSAAAALSVLLGTLAEDPHGRMAVRLTELCAFLSPDGVSLSTLCSSAMLHQLELAAGVDGKIIRQDSAELHRVLRSATRYGLFDIAWGRGVSVRMHRIVQDLIRASIDPDDLRTRQKQVLCALAGYAPTDAEGDALARTDNYAELGKHLVPSGALDSDDQDVRRWVVQQIRFAYRDGDAERWRSTVILGERLLMRWTQTFGFGDCLCLRLAGQLANLHRKLGRNAQALDLDERVLLEQRRTLGLVHPRTLATARGRGGDLRGLGRFREALAEDQATWGGFRDAYGEDNAETLMAANNLAWSSFLVGDVDAALRIGRETVERRRRLFGIDDPLLWHSVNTVAVCLRELGRFDEARENFRSALERTRALGQAGLHDELRIKKDIAITRRLTNDSDSALQEHMNVLRGYQGMLGDNHPDTSACMVSLTGDYHQVGRTADAVDLAGRCLQWYRSTHGVEHPFSQICQVNLSVFHRAARQTEESLAAGEVALDGLRDQLGEMHPWALAAALAHARTLAAAGQLDRALTLEESTYDYCCNFLGTGHPYTTHAANNAAHTRSVIAGQTEGSKQFDIHLEVPST